MILGVCAIGVASAACTEKKTETAPPPAATAVAPVTPPPPPGPDAKALAERAKAIFGTPQPTHTTEDATVESARVELGRMLYYDKRLSKNQDLSCNSCHDLAGYGVDVREKDGQRTATSEGHKGQFGGRNSPTSYNAFFHVAQFWDGRAKDVEEQAMGPMLNPVEMAMKDAKAVEKVLKSIPDYGPKFKAAFPEEKGAITQANAARAIAAFERKLVTPAPIDAFLAGNTDALTTSQLKGLELFMERCVACHMGPGFGGAIYQKLGLIKPYPTKDEGRFEATKNEADKGFFKVPSLRNIAKTGPYFHDGSLGTLKEAVSIMAEHQTAQGALSDAQMADLLAFLDSLTGELPTAFIAEPALPASSKKTPKPDPS
jgi:cytochrome c peroxidase